VGDFAEHLDLLLGKRGSSIVHTCSCYSQTVSHREVCAGWAKDYIQDFIQHWDSPPPPL